MPRAAWFSAVALLALAASPATQPVDDVAKLVQQLANPEPSVRKEAYDRLAALGPAALPALSTAARGPSPAIADAAADLMLKIHSVNGADPKDQPSIRLILIGYGQQDPAGRAEMLQTVIQKQPDNYRKVVVRVLQQDPSDEVGWKTLERVQPDAEWETALTSAGVDSLTDPLKLLLARAKDRRGDTAGALELVNAVLDHEQDRFTATGSWLVWAVQLAANAEAQQNHYDDAAARLRELISRSSDDPANRSTLVDQLLDLHARHGPLKGFADDLKLADQDTESRSTYAMALAADRLGLPEASHGLLQAAMRPRESEAEPDRMARLSDTADALFEAGQYDAACHIMDVVAQAESPLSRGRVTYAYARLSQAHALSGRMALAGDALQRAIDRQDSSFTTIRNGRPEIRSIEDVQANVYLFYLLDAQARGDAAAINKQAKLMIASGSTESGLFLDGLYAIESAGSREEVDAYFTRVFDRAKEELNDNVGTAVYYNDIAWLCARSNRKLDDAVRWAETAVKMAPGESAYLDTLAEAKFRTRRFDEAVDLETRALVGNPDDEAFMQKQLKRFKAATTQPTR